MSHDSKKQTGSFFGGFAVVVAYLAGAAAVVSGYLQNHFLLLFALLIFLTWDTGFAFPRHVFAGLAIDDSITRARTHVPWFIALYGAALGLAVADADPVCGLILCACHTASVPAGLLAIPLGLALISVPLIPVSLCAGGPAAESPSAPQRAPSAFVVHAEKVILLLFGDLGLRTLSAWPTTS